MEWGQGVGTSFGAITYDVKKRELAWSIGDMKECEKINSEAGDRSAFELFRLLRVTTSPSLTKYIVLLTRIRIREI